MDFVSGLPMKFNKNNTIWVIVDRLTKSAHFIPVRTDFYLAKLTKLYIKVGTTEKIRAVRDRLKVMQSCQKSYADLKRREVEYDISDFVFLKVFSMRGVTRFGIKGKLAPRYVGPFEIVEKIGEVAYRLNLSLQLGHVHDVFYVSMLKNYTSDPSHVLPYTGIPLQADITYEE